MNERIKKLTELTLEGKMYANPVATEFDREDLLLPRQQMESKRICEFILNQEPVITQYSKMTGFFNFDDSVVGDAFRRKGHANFNELKKNFIRKPIDNLTSFEWQHATADYKKVLAKGLKGIIEEIDASLKTHTSAEQVEFLHALTSMAKVLVSWAHKCSEKAMALSKTVTNAEYKENLEHLAKALLNVPENKPNSFYEAVLTIYICFSADPDSVGTLDRYLNPFFEHDMENGLLTAEEAKEYLQELFLMLQAATPITSKNFTRGGESHFCIGGYLPDGTDGFCRLSQLILESLMELPTYIPQVSLRWTAKTPKEVFRFVLDCERKDPLKRIAFQNDEKRIRCYTELCGIPFEEAVGYTTTGCNEPAFLGAIIGSTTAVNFARSMGLLFQQNHQEIENAPSYSAFYTIFLEGLFRDLDRACRYDDAFNRKRAEDINYLSSLFFQGCIEKATSLTQGAGDRVIASPFCIGITNVIDSLIIVKQFVFDEQIVTMKELTAAIRANWEGYEDLHRLIVNKGDFFGNDTPRSNGVARQLYQDVYEYWKDKTNLFGYHWLIGDLTGYSPYNAWFGEKMGATPDGRYAGEALKFGLGQSGGYDRNGLVALLNAIAGIDPNGIGCGCTVTNLFLDDQLVKQDANFEKTVDMLETYFKMGGVHFQLNYVSKENLLNARITPEKYKNLRVRVSGYSDYFVKLSKGLQEDVIKRTEQK